MGLCRPKHQGLLQGEHPEILAQSDLTVDLSVGDIPQIAAEWLQIAQRSQRCIGYVDHIAGRSPAIWASNKCGVGKHAIFEQNASIYSPDGADGCCITSNKSLTCLQLVFTSNWSNFRHAFASRGFVSVAGLSNVIHSMHYAVRTLEVFTVFCEIPTLIAINDSRTE